MSKPRPISSYFGGNKSVSSSKAMKKVGEMQLHPRVGTPSDYQRNIGDHKYSLDGVELHFPYKAYGIQIEYMKKVIECLNNRQNGLLESPTGTGKTLSLLCSALSWQQKNLVDSTPIEGDTEFLKEDSDEEPFNKSFYPQKGSGKDKNQRMFQIIYASRTHSQLKQVIGELKKTKYFRKVRVSVMGSRDQLCIHPDAKNIKGNALHHFCKNQREQEPACKYFRGARKDRNKSKDLAVMDMEDLCCFGRKNTICPYYYAREQIARVDVVMVPYVYMIDPIYRKSVGLNIKNSILIFDEAHNLDSYCNEVTSFELSVIDVTRALKEIDTTISLLEIGVDANSEYRPESYKELRTKLLNLEDAIEREFVFGPTELRKGKTYPAQKMYRLYESIGLDQGSAKFLIGLIESGLNTLSSRPNASSSGVGLNAFLTSLRLLYEFTPGHQFDVSPYYRLHVYKNDVSQKGVASREYNLDTRKKLKSTTTLGYWCFQAGVCMEKFLELSARSIILTSGTLSPLAAFSQEMRIPFERTLENPHIVNKKQIFVAIVKNGPTGVELNSKYDNRKNAEYIRDLGNTLINIARQVPKGLLIFFPSYFALKEFTMSWKSKKSGLPTIWDRLSKLKKIFEEPHSSSQLKSVVGDYYAHLAKKQNEAIFMGVCRGKVSEGLDFSDDHARAVIVIGIPFPSLMDHKVSIHRQFLDEHKQLDKTLVSGSEWYTQQAIRTVNQAIGRIFRHSKDYGAIYLLDSRYCQRSIQNQLSIWIRPHIKVLEFGELIRCSSYFYKSVKNLDFEVMAPATVEPIGDNSEMTITTASIDNALNNAGRNDSSNGFSNSSTNSKKKKRDKSPVMFNEDSDDDFVDSIRKSRKENIVSDSEEELTPNRPQTDEISLSSGFFGSSTNIPSVHLKTRIPNGAFEEFIEKHRGGGNDDFYSQNDDLNVGDTQTVDVPLLGGGNSFQIASSYAQNEASVSSADKDEVKFIKASDGNINRAKKRIRKISVGELQKFKNMTTAKKYHEFKMILKKHKGNKHDMYTAIIALFQGDTDFLSTYSSYLSQKEQKAFEVLKMASIFNRSV